MEAELRKSNEKVDELAVMVKQMQVQLNEERAGREVERKSRLDEKTAEAITKLQHHAAFVQYRREAVKAQKISAELTGGLKIELKQLIRETRVAHEATVNVSVYCTADFSK